MHYYLKVFNEKESTMTTKKTTIPKENPPEPKGPKTPQLPGGNGGATGRPNK